MRDTGCKIKAYFFNKSRIHCTSQLGLFRFSICLIKFLLCRYPMYAASSYLLRVFFGQAPHWTIKMSLGKTYVLVLTFFGVFLVVSTLQLGKSRTTLNLIQQKSTTSSTNIEVPPITSPQLTTRPTDAPLKLSPDLTRYSAGADTIFIHSKINAE